MFLKKLGSLFDREIESLTREIYTKRCIQAGVALLSCAFPIAAVAVPIQHKNLLAWELGLGVSLGAASCFIAKSREELEKRYSSFIELNRTHYREGVKKEFAFQGSLQEARAEIDLAKSLLNLPPAAQLRYVEKFELHGLLMPEMHATTEDKPGQATITMDVNSSVIEEQLQAIAQKNPEVDLSWLDDDFIEGSKIVAGVKGSGKSTYLLYEASRWFIKNYQRGGVLFICDPHLDENSGWLNNLPYTSIYNQILFKKPDDIYNCFVILSKELNNRIDKGLKIPNVPPLKIICDELEHLGRRLDKTQFQFVLATLEAVQDEGRKYGIDITIGMHSLKKTNTGVDSSTLQQMHWLLFEKAAYDSSTRFPSDFDQKAIQELALQVNRTVPKELGRTIVVIRTDGYQPIVTVLPLLKAPLINLGNQETPEEDEITGEEPAIEPNDVTQTSETQPVVGVSPRPDFYGYMRKWLALCLTEHGRMPPREHIRKVWEEISGQLINEPSLDFLIGVITDGKGLI